MLKAHLIAGISVAKEHILKKYLFDTVSKTNWYKWHLKILQRKLCLFFGYTPGPCRAIHLPVTLSFSHEHSTKSIPNYLNVVRLLHLQYTATLTHLKTPCSGIRKLCS